MQCTEFSQEHDQPRAQSGCLVVHHEQEDGQPNMQQQAVRNADADVQQKQAVSTAKEGASEEVRGSSSSKVA